MKTIMYSSMLVVIATALELILLVSLQANEVIAMDSATGNALFAVLGAILVSAGLAMFISGIIADEL